MAERKFYWLKLKRDFFKRHDIRIIEEMPNGRDYILFYLKMLLESIDHEGELRFSETIPYNEQMLSVITNTNIDIVKSAMKIFIDLNMIEVFDDSTIYMSEVQRLIGSETMAAERQRKSRANKKLLSGCDNVTELSQDGHIEIEKEKEKEIEKDKDIISVEKPKRKKFVPPTLEEVQAYCLERKNNVDAKQFYDYFTVADWYDSKGQKVKSWKQKIITWEKNSYKDNQSKAKVNFNPEEDSLDDLF